MRPLWLFALQSAAGPSSSLSSSTSFVRSTFPAILSASIVTTTEKFRMAPSNRSNDGDNNTSQKNLVVDPFCFRQFAEHGASKSYGGTVFQISVSDFEDIANTKYNEDDLVKGYAPFCKHLFIENDFDGGKDIRVNVLPVEGNEHLIRTSYQARNDKELPVLQRFIPADSVKESDLPVAKYFDLILYSREQIRKENESMGKPPDDDVTAPWGIVSIKAQMEDYELPMNPITQMRNALGKDQGGSGIPLDRDEYMTSVRYWEANVVVS